MTALPGRTTDLWRRSRRLEPSPAAGDVALLVARIALGWIFVYHGARTLFGAFGGPGVHGASAFFATVAGLHPGALFAFVDGAIQFFGGLALAVGVLGRVAAAAIAGDMAMAMATVTWGNGISSSRPGGGYELNLALCCLAVVVALLGTGRIGLDRALKAAWEQRRRSAGAATTPGAPGVGISEVSRHGQPDGARAS
ncbi:MAG TPA: DoxX family protein [Acidimicrobiales bacterium]|nr:DoxX family protein [Acidimicrobiales bacterium]